MYGRRSANVDPLEDPACITAGPSPDVLDPSGGANQIRVRAYNERLVLSLVRRHGSLSKADIARRTGLSAQTVSVIMRALEKDGLLLARRADARPRRPAVRSRCGSIPMPSIPSASRSAGAAPISC